MTAFIQPLFRYTVPSNTGTFRFLNIPSTFTDLKVEISGAMSNSGISGDMVMGFDSASAIYSSTYFSGGYNQRQANNTYFLMGNAPMTSSPSIFSNATVYIPNYAESQNKQVYIETTSEYNGSTNINFFVAGLYRSTSPITTIGFGTAGNGNWITKHTYSIWYFV